MSGHRTLTLVKGPERYVFGWEPERTADLLSVLAQLAGDPEVDFDWFDAAMVAYQVGRLHPESALEAWP